jgi:transcriptional antiterminator RfaH
MTWLAVHTRPRQEALAAQNLQRQGYTVFLPELQQRKRRAGKWQRVAGPLFPRYLFVEVRLGEQSTVSIRSTTGVVGLVRFGHELVPVDPAIIQFLQESQRHDLGKDAEEDWPHKPGDRVDILSGPFAGLSGIYQIANDAERATLLIDLLGRRTGVAVDRHNLGDTIEQGGAESPGRVKGHS